jgi:Domain of unknown function (DUF4190)
MGQPPYGSYGPYDPNQPPFTQPGGMQPYQQPYGSPYQQPVYYYAQPLPTSGLATASMVLGIIGLVGGWCLFGIPCILAVIFGHMANRDIRTGQVGGQGMATAGLVMGYIVVGPAVVVTILFLAGAFGTGLASG